MKALVRFWRKYSDRLMIYGLLLLFMAVSVLLDEDFLSTRNLRNIFTSNMPFLMGAYAQTIVILAGGVDLSIGAGISLVTCICATCSLTPSVGGLMFAFLLAFAAMLLKGSLNGLLITKCGIQPLICTLAVSLITAGCALAVLGKPGGSVAKEFAKPFTTPLSLVIIFFMVTVVLCLLLYKTRLGKAIYATGGNSACAYSAGISVDGTILKAYLLSGALAALGGIILSCQMRSGDPIAGDPLTLKTLTASVMGGASFSGGKGRIECTFAGVLIFAIINNILNLIGISSFYQYVAQGVLLIVAITLTSDKRRQ